MPTYDYICDACEHSFEVFQRIDEEILERCPQCDKKKLRRLFGAGSGLLFKGAGFYETDYRSDGYKKRQKEDRSDSSPKKDSASEKTPKKSDEKSSS